MRDNELRIVVIDSGLGFGPRVDSPGAGFGLPIIATIADGYEIRQRDPTGTELRFSFKL